jgi:hypothetical protein
LNLDGRCRVLYVVPGQWDVPLSARATWRVALSSARPTTLKQRPIRTVTIYNLFRRRYRARRLGIEFRRGANWILPGEMFVNSMRWAISAPYDNILCERCWILPLTLDFQRARSEYLFRCDRPHLGTKSSLESEALLTF